MTNGSPRRMFTSAYPLLGITAICAILPLRVASQETLRQDDTGAIAQLQAQLAELQRKVDRIDGERGTIRAPFVVHDEAGKQIFAVVAAPTPRLLLGDPSGARAQINILASGGAVLNLADSSNQVRVSLFTEPGQTELSLSDNAMIYNLGTGDDGTTGLVMGRDNHKAVEINVDPAGGALRLFNASEVPTVALESTESRLVVSDGAGEPIVKVMDEKNATTLVVGPVEGPRVELGVAAGGAGSYVAMNDEASRRLVMSTEGANPAITLMDTNENPFFTVGVPEATGHPLLTVGRPDASRVEVGVGPGGNGSYVSMQDSSAERLLLRGEGTDSSLTLFDTQDHDFFKVSLLEATGQPLLTVGREGTSRVEVGVSPGAGGAYISMQDPAAERVLLRAEGADTSLALIDGQDADFFKVNLLEGTGPQLVLGHPTRARFLAGIGADGSYVSMWDTSSERAVLRAESANTSMQLMDAQETSFFSVGTLPETGRPHLTLGNPTAERVDLGVTQAGSFTSWTNSSNVERAALQVDDAGQVGLYLIENEKLYVNVRHNPETGSRVSLAHVADQPSVGLVASAEQGAQVLVNGEGSTRVVAALYNDGGGQLRLWDNTGETRVLADSNAQGHAQVSVLSGRGSVLLDATDQASPMVEVADAAGTPHVRAGISTTGVGIVMAGPAGNGAAGTMGGGLSAASEIIGKKN